MGKQNSAYRVVSDCCLLVFVFSFGALVSPVSSPVSLGVHKGAVFCSWATLLLLVV